MHRLVFSYAWPRLHVPTIESLEAAYARPRLVSGGSQLPLPAPLHRASYRLYILDPGPELAKRLWAFVGAWQHSFVPTSWGPGLALTRPHLASGGFGTRHCAPPHS